jgi:hypothetical protein
MLILLLFTCTNNDGYFHYWRRNTSLILLISIGMDIGHEKHKVLGTIFLIQTSRHVRHQSAFIVVGQCWSQSTPR